MKAYQIIDSKEKWCQGSFAKDTTDDIVYWKDSTACKFCLMGAIFRTYPNSIDRIPLYDKINEQTKSPSLSTWNDSPDRKWEDVYWLLKTLDI